MTSRLLTTALLSGALTGLIAGLLQLIFVQPVLLHAELYESGALVHFGAEPVSARPDLPMFDAMRDGLSVIFTMLTYTGYALILVAAMALGAERGAPITGRWGLVWGGAGFIAFHLAPGFSLAPEVPGVAAADLGARQLWWGLTVLAAGLALWLIAFGRDWRAWGTAVILLAAPHLTGAPMSDSFAGTVPPELAALFAARALGVGLVAWAVLGLSTAHFWAQEEADARREV